MGYVYLVITPGFVDSAYKSASNYPPHLQHGLQLHLLKYSWIGGLVVLVITKNRGLPFELKSFALPLSMIFDQSLSIFTNFFASRGICFAMSPPMKTLSRLVHSSWTFTHSSRLSVALLSSLSFPCNPFARAKQIVSIFLFHRLSVLKEWYSRYRLSLCSRGILT